METWNDKGRPGTWDSEKHCLRRKLSIYYFVSSKGSFMCTFPNRNACTTVFDMPIVVGQLG